MWHLALLPFFLSLALYALIIGFGWHWVHGLLSSYFLNEGRGWQILGWILGGVFWILTLVVSAFAFVPIATLVANPFNDLLSEKTERLYKGIDDNQPFSSQRLLRALWIGITGEIMRTLTLALLLVFAFSLGFVPFVGPPISAALSTFFTIRYLSLEYTSFSMDRRLYLWKEKKDFLRWHRARSLGFGAMAFLILTIPVVNAFFIPVSAVAGTLLFCDTELAERFQKPNSADSRNP